MMYILTDEPQGQGPVKEAFNAIDNAYGSEEFSDNQAVAAIVNSVGCSEAEATSLFSQLKNVLCTSCKR
jgi:hypothetical protein